MVTPHEARKKTLDEIKASGDAPAFDSSWIKKQPDPPVYQCSFCGVSATMFDDKLLAGPGVFICHDCVDICAEIVNEKRSEFLDGGEND